MRRGTLVTLCLSLWAEAGRAEKAIDRTDGESIFDGLMRDSGWIGRSLGKAEETVSKNSQVKTNQAF